jgi:hypothetical protein
MARILLADLCLVLGPGWMAAMFLFFSRDVMQVHHRPGQHPAGLLSRRRPAGRAVRRMGGHQDRQAPAAMLSTLIYSLALVSLLVLPKGNVLANIPTNFITGFVARASRR